MKKRDKHRGEQLSEERAFFWSRSERITGNPTVNVRFEDLLLMNDEALTVWINHMRSEIRTSWEVYGCPPLVGKTEQQMIAEFKALHEFSAQGVRIGQAALRTTKLGEITTGDVLRDRRHHAQAVNQFFPGMLKTKISYGAAHSGNDHSTDYSVYQLFAEPGLGGLMQQRCRRHFRKDSFYSYSPSVEAQVGLIRAATAPDWCRLFNEASVRFQEWNYWLSPDPDEKNGRGSGYTQVDSSNILRLTKSEVISLIKAKIVPVGALVNVCSDDLMSVYASAQQCLPDPEASIAELYGPELPNSNYTIRLFKRSTRIFPAGFTAFKIGYKQVAVNFPPMIAKYLYEKYTDPFKSEGILNVYDPSAGWGGRLAGALVANGDRHLHYIGTDPNTNNYLPEVARTRYECLGKFINCAIGNEFSTPHTFTIFRHGSEVIADDPQFKAFKGTLDLVFSSPPYYRREIYSDDSTQSAQKFPTYRQWRDGFLRPTLTTAYDYLRRGRYLLWNIADVRVGTGMLPLQADSERILKDLGAELHGIEWMVLAGMPGSNRVRDDGTLTCKNSVTVDGTSFKAEPIYVFWKP